MLVDTHCHINSLEPAQQTALSAVDRTQYLFIDSSINRQTTVTSLQLSGRYQGLIYTALGFHPFWAQEFTDQTISEYEHDLQANQNIVAIGEIGFDDHASIPINQQEQIFRQFIELAQKHQLPIMIHNRLADDRVFSVLNEHYDNYESVVFHCFSYGIQRLAKILDKGGTASFSLNILRNQKRILASLQNVPLESMILETDSPYMRINGEFSVPTDIDKVYQFAAQYKNVTMPVLEEAVYNNVRRVFTKIKNR